MQKTICLTHDKTRLELNVRLERQECPDGALDTDLNPVDEPCNRFSVSMGRWVRRGPLSPWREDVFGQDISGVQAFARHCPPAQRAAIERLCELWREWHLNDLQAGTAKQTEAIGLARAAGEIQDGAFYDTARIALEARGLLVDRGYSYGSKWLIKRVPVAVCTEVVALCETIESSEKG